MHQRSIAVHQYVLNYNTPSICVNKVVKRFGPGLAYLASFTIRALSVASVFIADGLSAGNACIAIFHDHQLAVAADCLVTGGARAADFDVVIISANRAPSITRYRELRKWIKSNLAQANRMVVHLQGCHDVLDTQSDFEESAQAFRSNPSLK